MATHNSAIKRERQSKKRRIRNVGIRSKVKNSIKKVLSAVENKKSEEAHSDLIRAISNINRGASKGVLHKNTASRKISRLTRKVNLLSVDG